MLTKNRDGTPLGKFVYGKSYLARNDAVEVDPVELKLTDETYETARLGGVFGALRDAGPDYWGRRVIEKHSGKAMLGEIDYLLESPDDRAGALSFGLGQEPPSPRRTFNKALDLAKLQNIADHIVRDEIKEKDDDAVQIEELMLIGTSMGGARPKTVVEDDQGLWIAKFNRADDRWNFAKVEHAMLVLAKKMRNQHRGKPDRSSRRQRRSACAQVRPLPAPELFRRMCFNSLISNIDDHPRNHALITKEREWNLSPSYDLMPSPVIAQERRELAMTCGDKGRFACASNILSQHTRFLLRPVDAQSIVESMRQQVSATWYDVVRAEGVSEKDAETIGGAFVYEGFNS